MKSKEQFIEELVISLQETYGKKYTVTYNSEPDRILMVDSQNDTFSFSAEGSYKY